MRAVIGPEACLHGRIDAISSKSAVHRLVCAALLCRTSAEIHTNVISDDIRATLDCAKALDCGIAEKDGSVILTPPASFPEKVRLYCGLSGTTARFFLPLAAALCGEAEIDAAPGLRRRPMAPLCEALRKGGCEVSSDVLPVNCRGRLRAGRYEISGAVSSQFISGMLFALTAAGKSDLAVTGLCESQGYVDLTVSILKRFGVKLSSVQSEDGCVYSVEGPAVSPGEISAEGDWTNAAVWLCAGAARGQTVEISGLDGSSYQRDRRILDVLRVLGADAEYIDGLARVHGSISADAGRVSEIDVSEIPDLAPAIAALACGLPGRTVLTGTRRLRYKETDRQTAVCEVLGKLGADISLDGDRIVISGHELSGGEVSSFGDHRMVMAAAVAAAFCRSKVIIDGAEDVAKSYPNFFEDYRRMGGVCECVG